MKPQPSFDESGTDISPDEKIAPPKPMQQTFESDLMSLYYDMQGGDPLRSARLPKTGVDEKAQR